MSELAKKRSFLPRWAQIVLAIGIVLLITVLVVLYGPREGESSNVTGDLPSTPTVEITELVSSQNVNRSVTIDGVQVLAMQVMQARKFSDDRKRIGTYTIRVQVQTKNEKQAPVGVDYASRVRLIMPDGKKIATKYISVKPVEIPGRSQAGFFDFPANEPVDLSSLSLLFDGKTVLSLKSA